MSTATRASRDLRTPVVLGAVVATATLLVAVRDPHDGGYPICPVLALTGFQCAGCGGLRAAHDLAIGDVAGAWAMNPLLTLAMPVLTLLWVVWLVRAATGRPARQPPLWLWIGLGVLVLAFSVLRNIPALYGVLGPAV